MFILSYRTPQYLCVFASFFVLCAIIYWSALAFSYGFSDDYSTIWHAQVSPAHWLNNDWTGGGRPIYGWLMMGSFAIAKNIDGLVWLRVANIACIAWFASLLYYHLKDYNYKASRAWFMVAVVTMLPSFAVNAMWATAFGYMFAAIFSFVGGRRLVHAIFKAECSSKNKYLDIIISASLLFVAECIYQPTAAYFLLPLLIYLIHQKFDNKRFFKCGIYFVIYFAVLSIYLAFIRVLQRYFITVSQGAERSKLIFDFGKQWDFFINNPLKNTFYSWSNFFPEYLQWGFVSLLVILLLCFGLRMIRQFKYGVGWPFLVTISIFGLSLAPVLLAGANYAPFRTLLVPATIFVLLAMMGGFWLIDVGRNNNSMSSRGIRAIGICALSLYVLANAVSASYFTYHGLVKSHVIELSQFREYYKKNIHAPINEIVFVKTPEAFKLTEVTPLYEFSILSTSHSWVPQALLNLLLIERLQQLGHKNAEKAFTKVKQVSGSQNITQVSGQNAKYSDITSPTVVDSRQILHNFFL